MKKYNIGLDIGTTSVGWAVVEEENQKIIRKGNKALWGVRLFEEAMTAEKRRISRNTRRRYDRRRNRIQLLQEEFKEEINRVDDKFFQKLQESKYNESDITNKTIKLTPNEQEQIKQYNDKYKTIYHLRYKLMNNPEKENIKLIYLALHHIIKYRGNFQYGNSYFNINNINVEEKLESVFTSLQENIYTLEIPEDFKEIINLKELSTLLLNPSKNDIKVGIKEIIAPIINKAFATELGKLLVGNNFNINKLFMIDNADYKIEISFNGSDYDDKYEELEKLLGDKVEILEELKELYDAIFLKRLFKGNNNSISDLMIDKFNQHGKDFKLLKGLFHNNKQLYNKLLRTGKDICIYEQYLKNKISNEDFIRELNNLLEALFSSKIEIDQKYLNQYNLNAKNRIENGEFLPRITDVENGKYPYQLNKVELIKIIENQGKYYPFLLNKTRDGKYRILKIFEFKIPYYIGPLVSEKRSKFAWMERKIDNVKITPYNFDEVVDKEKTAEKFIKRMISHCTYLLDEYALPNNSIYYSRYKVLNELKQIKVNDIPLTNEQQQNIIKNLFEKTSGNITNKKFIEYLKGQKDFNMYDEINVRGYSDDNKFSNNLQSYYDFFGPNGIFENTTYSEEDADKIIEWITIFNDKDILEKKIKDTYKDLTSYQINLILSKKYSGWGSLSKKLLSTKYYKDKETGNYKSIMNLMEETEANFMQIINDDEYNFQKMIKENNNFEANEKLNYSMVEPLATSPSTKKGIYQALKVVDEIVKHIGYEPSNIMIEMARGEEKKNRKDNRKKYLTELYKTNAKEIANYNKLKGELDKYEINSQKMFLYFIQEGKCLYSGNQLNIEDLDLYEIDHIIPRTLIKDDSIDNKALVYRECNQIKGANYVLPSEYRSKKNKAWWKHLRDLKLISPKKFHNLIREKYSDDDIEGFINRQLVETRQITKHVANILNNFYENTKVIYLKSNLLHNYRERYDLFKLRDINDYHHAHDAYLAAVLGEYKEKYLKKKINFEMIKELNNRFRELNEYNKLKYGYVINSLDEKASNIVNEISKNHVDEETGEILFDAYEFNKNVEHTLYRNDILISKKTEIRTGEFYNQTKQKKGKRGVPLKKNLSIEQYGSYTSINPSYAVMIKFVKNGKIQQRLVGVPIYLTKTSEDQIIEYFKQLLKLEDENLCEIISKPIPFYSLINWDGQLGYLVGASDTIELCNGKEFQYEKEFYKENKYILNRLFNKKEKDVNEAIYNQGLNKIIIYIINKVEKEYKLFNNLVSSLKEMVDCNNLNKYSIEQKENIIKQLTKMLNCKSDNANFKFLNSKYSSAFGKKNSRIVNSCKVINQSCTGIKENINEF